MESTRDSLALTALRLGVEMRRKQKAYFKSRTQADLDASKAAERAFDAAAEKALAAFNEPGTQGELPLT